MTPTKNHGRRISNGPTPDEAKRGLKASDGGRRGGIWSALFSLQYRYGASS